MSESRGPLSSLRVLDLSESVAGMYAAKMLADAGADVVLVEPPEGNFARRWDPAPDDSAEATVGLLHAYLNANKRGITLDLKSGEGRETLTHLVGGFDLVIDTWQPADSAQQGLDYASLGAGYEHLVWVSVTPFGTWGPYAGYRGGDFVVQAASGWMHPGGEPGREPLKTGGNISDYITGSWAAMAALGAWHFRQATGLGQHVDVSGFDAVSSTTGYAALARSAGSTRRSGRSGQPFPFSIVRAADGWVGINILTPGQWAGLCAFMGRDDLRDDPRFVNAGARALNSAELTTIIADWAGRKTVEELFAANEQRVPIVQIPTVAESLNFAHHEARSFFVEQELGEAGRVRQPGVPFRMDSLDRSVRRPAPKLGEHNAEVLTESPSPPTRAVSPAASPAGSQPLSGLRIADVSMWWAGPFCTQILGDLGAEVVKVESVQVLDGWRSALAGTSEVPWWEASPAWTGANRNKLGMTLDLTRPQGVDLFKRLVAASDIVVENYTPRVMGNFGLGYEELAKINPGIIMLALPAYGGTGPWRDYSGFAFPVEEMAGFPQLTGYEDDGIPRRWGNASADAIAGLTGAFAILAALEHRRRTGQGQYIDLSQLECLAAYLGEPMLDYQVNGRVPRRIGNRHGVHAPHNVYPAAGDDAWLAIAVTAEPEWHALCHCLGRHEWAADARLATAAGRRANHAEIDGAIAEWTVLREPAEAAAQLQHAGVPAMPVFAPDDLLDDQHLAARDYWHESERPLFGRHTHGLRWAQFSRSPLVLHRPAPTLGQHNESLLGGLLGLSDAKIEALAKDHIIGKEPLSGPRI